MNEAISQIVHNYSTRIKDDKIFFSPNISEKKLKNALSSYAMGAINEKMLVLIDNTAFGNAKDGALLTTRSFYAHNIMEQPKHILLGDIVRVILKEGVIAGSLYINGSKFLETNMPRKSAMQVFADMLNEIAVQFRYKRDYEKTTEKLNDNGLIVNETNAQKYSVLLTGKLTGNMNRSDVKKRFATLFKLSRDRADKLFQKVPVFIRKGLDRETALKYKNRIEKVGAKCEIVQEKQTAITGPKLKKPINSDSSSLTQTPFLTPKIIADTLRKINERHFSRISNNVLKIHGTLPRFDVDKARTSCEIPSECEIIAVINKLGDYFILAFTSRGIYWSYREKRYFINYTDFRKIKIEVMYPSDISIGANESIHISLKVNFEVIHDILVAFQYFLKYGRHIPEDQLLFKPPTCPHCGSVRWITTTEVDSMNWKAGFIASMLGGPLVGALTGSALGKTHKVKKCLSCHYVEKIDER